jgi:hypothetical protein
VRRDQPIQLTRVVALDRQPAPVRAGDRVGRVLVRMGDKVIAEVPAVAAVEVPSATTRSPRCAGMCGRGLIDRLLAIIRRCSEVGAGLVPAL